MKHDIWSKFYVTQNILEDALEVLFKRLVHHRNTFYETLDEEVPSDYVNIFTQ